MIADAAARRGTYDFQSRGRGEEADEQERGGAVEQIEDRAEVRDIEQETQADPGEWAAPRGVDRQCQDQRHGERERERVVTEVPDRDRWRRTERNRGDDPHRTPCTQALCECARAPEIQHGAGQHGEVVREDRREHEAPQRPEVHREIAVADEQVRSVRPHRVGDHSRKQIERRDHAPDAPVHPHVGLGIAAADDARHEVGRDRPDDDERDAEVDRKLGDGAERDARPPRFGVLRRGRVFRDFGFDGSHEVGCSGPRGAAVRTRQHARSRGARSPNLPVHPCRGT